MEAGRGDGHEEEGSQRFRHAPTPALGAVSVSYVGPDLARHTAPQTFSAKIDAEHWMAAERRLIDADQWVAPRVRAQARQGAMTLRDYAQGAVDRRRVRGEPLKPRTRALYASQLDRLIYPTFGDRVLRSITRDDVARWYDALGPQHPTQRAHAYSLLRAVMGQAVVECLVSSSPCQIPGASRVSRQRRIEPASLPELAAIVEGMPERLRLLVVLGAWCALRYGELAELRRHDVDLERGVLSISRAVVRVDGADLVGRPKSVAGVRHVAIPPHLHPAIQAHLDAHVAPGSDSLLFPRPGTNRHLIHTEVTKIFMTARAAAGRPDLRLHDLRHTGAVLAAQTGATLAELMARLGHSTPGAALRYQHAAAGRDAQIAARLSEMALQ
ncbi:phage integrase family protein [Ornithinibacter aureus]|nr:phage integrase family protein [Ornithinibacter aureus]